MQESDRRIQAILENSAGAIGMLDATGTLIYDSPAAPGMLGYEAGEMIGKSAFELVHADDLPTIQSMFQELVATPGARVENIIFRLRRKNGQWAWIEGTAANLLAEPAVHAIVLNYQDITSRVHAEESLRESEERFRQVWENTSDAMVLSDSEGIVLDANQAYLALYGYSASQIIGKSFAIIFPQELRKWAVEQYKIAFADETVPAPFESTVRRADGAKRVVDSRVAFLTKAGKRIAMLSTIRDITERVQAEEALSQSHRHLELLLAEQQETQIRIVAQERLAAVGQLAAGIAHDFNNVMAVIVLYSEMVEKSLLPADKRRSYLATITQQARHASDLIQQILDFSRQSTLRRAPIDILPMIEELMKIWQRTLPGSISLRLAAEPGEYWVYGDRTRLQQVLMNLVINARDAMVNGGLLALSLAQANVERDEEPLLPDMTPGPWICLTIADTGTGIPAELLPRIFEPYFTTKAPGKGTGLGLAQVYGIVKQHEGNIHITSEVGVGTTFTLYLPSVDRAAPDKLKEGSLAYVEGSGETILLVDDTAAVLESMQLALENLNYRVCIATSGDEALERLEQESAKIDLLLSDLVMPEMSGLQLCQAAGQKYPHLKMMLMTGYQPQTDADALPVSETISWIEKPVTLTVLASKIHDALHAHPAT